MACSHLSGTLFDVPHRTNDVIHDLPTPFIEPGAEVRFLCDAMLGGLARWLRAAGYDAEFQHGISDPALVARGHATGRIVLSSDRGIFARSIVRTGVVRALFIPRHRPPLEQLTFALGRLGLPIRDPRCMACGGGLVEVEKESVRGEAPPITFENVEQFWRCTACSKLLWKGSHWQGIMARIGSVNLPLARSA